MNELLAFRNRSSGSHWIGFQDFLSRRNSERLTLKMTTRADQWVKVALTIESAKEVSG